MKKMMRTLTLLAMMTLGLQTANAGVSLIGGAVVNLVQGYPIAAAIGAGLGAGATSAGVKLVQNGRIGWGVFLIVLEDEGLMGADEIEVLKNVDVDVQETVLNVLASDMDEETKVTVLEEVLN